jgi:hypothetical protein
MLKKQNMDLLFFELLTAGKAPTAFIFKDPKKGARSYICEICTKWLLARIMKKRRKD